MNQPHRHAPGQGRLRRALVLALTGVLALPGRVAAEEVNARDARAVRSVIEAQLAAFAVADAERAFALATDAIRQQFGNATTFMAMVRSGYPMVVRPEAVAFFQPAAVDGMVLQEVQLRDGEDRLWLATYQVARQPDASWRINGCTVVPAVRKRLI